MKWNSEIIKSLSWPLEIKNREAKEIVAKKISEKVNDGDIIGFGSGSTCYLAIKAISEKINNENLKILAIPTSYEVQLNCVKFGISTVSFAEESPDWYFDGADEVDPDNNLIKGRGGAMFKEKILMSASSKNYIIADQSKIVPSLGINFPVPIEIYPMSIMYVEKKLRLLGVKNIALRLAIKKDGPVITENGNFIFDVHFEEIYPSLEAEIKKIVGVIESGLFINYKPEIILS